MTSAATRSAESARDKRAEALVASFERAGYTRVAPAILQPAEPFLDLSGEDIRKRMFLTTDPHGRELCLRPDLTIPVSRLSGLACGRQGAWVLLPRAGLPAPPERIERIPAGRHRIIWTA
jgi:ATP phosphoribosyltransferase regulatory subunit